MTKLIVGCGYLGSRVARLWIDDGQSVAALTRSCARADELKQRGIQSVVADITQPATLDNLPEAETVLFAVGYDSARGYSRREYYINGLRAIVNTLSPKTQRFILISSTSVYGQTDGQWVDKNSPCVPKTESGWAFLETEKALAASQFGPCAIILRLAGLYGPGRILRRANELLAGKPIIALKERFTNLIHVEDAAAAVIAADKLAKPPCNYIVADGHPVQYQDYIAYLAELLGATPPEFVEVSSSEFNQSRRLTNKRLSNAKMLVELDVHLKYPTYKEGLNAVLNQESRAKNALERREL